MGIKPARLQLGAGTFVPFPAFAHHHLLMSTSSANLVGAAIVAFLLLQVVQKAFKPRVGSLTLGVVLRLEFTFRRSPAWTQYPVSESQKAHSVSISGLGITSRMDVP
jgi:hypothetical protein